MKLSIITVSYNSASTIRDSIESVLSQSYKSYQYIIIDGGSTDGTIDIIDEYIDHIDFFISEPDLGIYDAMNKGISVSDGDVIGFLNSDDFYESSDVLEKIVNSFEASDSDIVYGDVVFVATDNLIKVKRYYNSSRFRVWKLRFGWMPAHPATFVKSSVYRKYGNYSLDYKIAADFEFFVRSLFRNTVSLRYINLVCVRMRLGGISTKGVSNSLLLNKEIVRACKENGVYTNLLFVLFKMPFKVVEFIRLYRD